MGIKYWLLLLFFTFVMSDIVPPNSQTFIPFLSTDVSIPNGSGVWSFG